MSSGSRGTEVAGVRARGRRMLATARTSTRIGLRSPCRGSEMTRALRVNSLVRPALPGRWSTEYPSWRDARAGVGAVTATVAETDAVHADPPGWASCVHVALKVRGPGTVGVKSTFRCVVSSYWGSRARMTPGG